MHVTGEGSLGEGTSTFVQRLESYRNKLLEMSMTNPLLNYRDTRSSTLRIDEPGMDRLWDLLVKTDGGSLTFPLDTKAGGAKSDAAESEIAGTESTGGPSLDNPDGVVADKTYADMVHVLRRLSALSKTTVEEQGINSLFVAFGLLVWKEEDANGNPMGDEHFAPLLLVPVSLARESIRSPYVLTRHEDEIEANQTLAYRLSEYGFVLPAYTEGDTASRYLSRVESVASLRGWRVVSTVVLARFSYQKMSMFNDLMRNAERILGNPVFRSICGDGSLLPVIDDSFEEYDYDKRGQEDLLQVVDADSSQLDAMRLAQAGVSFVMQGPPGTGKSQTITNIIADALGHGKTVLFVSEKKAALDVVQRRLKQAGLSDFCLVLHGTKSQSKSVNDQLRRSVELSSKSASLRSEAEENLATLREDRAALLAYASAITEPQPPLGRTPYVVLGEISKLFDMPDITFTPTFSVKDMDARKLGSAVNCATDLATAAERIKGGPLASPFYAMSADALRNNRVGLTERFVAVAGAVEKAVAALDRLGELLDCDVAVGASDLEKLSELIGLQADRPNLPSRWPLDIELRSAEATVDKGAVICSDIWKASKAAASYAAQAAERSVGIDPTSCVEGMVDSSSVSSARSLLAAKMAATETLASMNQSGLKQVESVYSQLMPLLSDWADVNASVSAECDAGIRSIDARVLRDRFRNEYTSFFSRLFSGTYKADLASVRSHLRAAPQQFKQAEALEVLDRLCMRLDLEEAIEGLSARANETFGPLFNGTETNPTALSQAVSAYRDLCACMDALSDLATAYAMLEDAAPRLSELLGDLYDGIGTDWDGKVADALAWASSYRAVIEALRTSISCPWVQRLSVAEHGSSALRALQDELYVAAKELQGPLDSWTTLFDDQVAAKGEDLRQLAVKARSCANSTSGLENWLEYCDRRDAAEAEGIDDYVRAAEKSNLSVASYAGSLKKALLTAWYRSVCESRPALAHFAEDRFERIQRSFGEEDMRRFDVVKAQIYASLLAGLPSMQAESSNDERALLKRELRKQRRLLPPRRLFNDIPHLLLKLKPCLMMSPLSVSMYLESDAFEFDLVVFDEASQVRTQDALGAICRGRQVIIAGDSKQLPPTSFFDARNIDTAEEGTDEYYGASEAFDSVLDESYQLPQVMLKWHYRSRDESLITFSNRKFYENGLVTFPSDRTRGKDWGLEFIYVRDGVYEGSRRGNRIEAERVADLVVEHMHSYGRSRSLGVIAFGQNQQEIIENALQRRAMSDPALEAFLAEDDDAPFFVKNLENVQGDERDTIILSVGYGKDPDGRLRLNFGPLNREGGERRLNVAVTRAIRNLKVVSSIDPADIAARNANTSGPLLLHSYLEYAKVGDSSLSVDAPLDDVLAFDSPFEESVYDFLSSHGFDVASQVGCSSYRIDLAVRDPQNRAHFVCGIECDGASYHSGRTARERDRLRQSVLEGMGWKLIRIWSTEWFRRPTAAREELLEKVHEAIGAAAKERVGASVLQPVEKQIASDGSSDELLVIAERQEGDPAVFADYEKACREFLAGFGSTSLNLYRFAEAAMNELGPISVDTILRLYKQKTGNRANKSTRNSIESALHHLVVNQKARVLKERDSAFYCQPFTKAVARTSGERAIDEISLEELVACFEAVFSQQLLMDKSKYALIGEVARALGYRRKGSKIIERLETAYDRFLLNRREQEL